MADDSGPVLVPVDMPPAPPALSEDPVHDGEPAVPEPAVPGSGPGGCPFCGAPVPCTAHRPGG